MEPWSWTGKGVLGFLQEPHQGYTALLQHRPTAFGCADHYSSTRESVFCFKKGSALRWLMQCAALVDAVRCIGTCTALHFSGRCFPSARRAAPTGQPDQRHRPYNPAHTSCISCFTGAKNTTVTSAHFSPLPKDVSSNRRQDPVLCPKNSLQIADKTQSFVQRSSTNSQHIPLHCPKQSSGPSKRSHWKQEKPAACPILNGFATGLLLSSPTPPDGIRLQKEAAGRVKGFTWFRSALTVK